MRHHTFAMAVMMSVHRSCCIRQFLINSTFVLVTVVVAVVVVIGVKITRPMWTFSLYVIVGIPHWKNCIPTKRSKK